MVIGLAASHLARRGYRSRTKLEEAARTGAHVTGDLAVTDLRNKIGAALIETGRGVGYRLVDPDQAASRAAHD
jgi:DNA-binding response OmpR family regulator